jgi:hypothetical protein
LWRHHLNNNESPTPASYHKMPKSAKMGLSIVG